MTSPVAVIGVGNEMRRDDGVGLAVAAEVGRRNLPGVQVSLCDGEATRLLELWSGTALTVIVDAVRCEPPRPGRIHRFSTSALPGRQTPASSHTTDLEAAWQLGLVLDRVPERLIIVAIEAADLTAGPGLSPAVARAVPKAASAVVREITRTQTILLS
ncbi:MAG: hydrogenase maturation protease [Nocardiaceae bacterium]|nr:hydrogenase maturation protease [Nocardiaceae bacterium]